ncbi:MAG: TetR/AcrR family transcriptional regulator [Myxococcota bacterium]
MTETPETDARTRILDAAEQAFAVAGLAGARVAGIVEAAGVNKATLYYYFDSKQELYEAVLMRVFDQLRDLARGVASDAPGDEAEAMVQFVERYGEIVAEHPNVVRILLRGLLDAPDEVLRFMVPRIAQVLPPLAAYVAQGQAAGRVNAELLPPLVPPMLVAPMVFFTVAAPLIESITHLPQAELRAAWMRNLRAQSLKGLLAREEE